MKNSGRSKVKDGVKAKGRKKRRRITEIRNRIKQISYTLKDLYFHLL